MVIVISTSNYVNPKNRQQAPFFDQDTSIPTLKAPSCLLRLSFISSTLDSGRSTALLWPQKGSKFTKRESSVEGLHGFLLITSYPLLATISSSFLAFSSTHHKLPACYAGAAQRVGGLPRIIQKKLPINIERLLNDDFLVKFFDYSASSRLRIFFARGSLISLWRGTTSVTPFFGFSQRE